MIQAYGNKVVIKDPEHMQERASGLILVGGDRLDVVESIVISAGPLCKDKTLAPGVRVLHTKLTGVKFDNLHVEDLPRGHYRIINESELLAVLSPEAKFEGGQGFYNADGLHETAKS